MDRKHIISKSYANIAIIKYWGKENNEKMIPSTSSISLTLENMHTTTKIFSNTGKDEFYLNNKLQDKTQTEKVIKIVNLFRKNNNEFVKIISENNMPTEAGLSSSSSGLSALVLACNEFFGNLYSKNELIQISKKASGSSCRSFLGPVVAWEKDSGNVYKINTKLKMAMIMLILNDNKKIISSRDGMKLCRDTSTNFNEWIEKSKEDFENMKKYLLENDFEKIGILTEKNAICMHETTTKANPSFSYLTDESYEAMEFVKKLRENGHKCYFSMDAGPNVKILCLEKDLEILEKIVSKKYNIISSKTINID